jgi:hypothetical protein
MPDIKNKKVSCFGISGVAMGTHRVRVECLQTARPPAARVMVQFQKVEREPYLALFVYQLYFLFGTCRFRGTPFSIFRQCGMCE